MPGKNNIAVCVSGSNITHRKGLERVVYKIAYASFFHYIVETTSIEKVG
jgi:hypothetical protein